MRVLNVNKFHYRRGGAETAYFDLARLLAERGHEVIPFAMSHPENEPSEWARFFPSRVEFRAEGGAGDKLRRALRVIYSREARDCLRRLLGEARPDLAHLHNIAHQLSPSILDALAEQGIPVVQTLHDYKLTCPVYLHRTSKGEICERCKGGRYYQCVLHRCNAGSTSMSLVNALEMGWHRMRGSYDAVDLFLCPSRYQIAKCLEFGVPAERLALVPHFVYARDHEPADQAGTHVLYAGRLSDEKGLFSLLDAHAAVPSSRLVLAGDGPLAGALAERVRRLGVESRTRLAGYLRGAEYEAAWREAAFLVLPSDCYEVRPMVIHEAYARGKPVVATRMGTIPEIVKEGETGKLVPPRDPQALAAAMAGLLADPQATLALGRAARAYVESELSPERHWQALAAAYERAFERHRGRAA